jgi:hypothetical protein
VGNAGAATRRAAIVSTSIRREGRGVSVRDLLVSGPRDFIFEGRVPIVRVI